MQDYQVIPQESIKRSRAVIENNMATLASNFSGKAFPTTALQIGMKCYREDLQRTYTLKSLDPLHWEDDAAAGTQTEHATLADKAIADGQGRKFEETYVLVSTRGKPQGVATLDETGKVPLGQIQMPKDMATQNYVTERIQVAIDALPKIAPRAEKDAKGNDIAGTYVPKDGAGAHGTWNISITGSAKTAEHASRADKADNADKAKHADEATLALNIPTYDRGGNIWIS